MLVKAEKPTDYDKFSATSGGKSVQEACATTCINDD
jgi:hypothetical protein